MSSSLPQETERSPRARGLHTEIENLEKEVNLGIRVEATFIYVYKTLTPWNVEENLTPNQLTLLKTCLVNFIVFHTPSLKFLDMPDLP